MAMKMATKLALISLNNSPFYLKVAHFHSIPVLDRLRRTHREYQAGRFYRSYYYSRKDFGFMKISEKKKKVLENWRQQIEKDEVDEKHDDEDNNGKDDDYDDDKDDNDDEENDNDEDDDDELKGVETDLRNDRIVLGLSESGPLNLQEVKNAYKAYALKWHPDRHPGSSKAIAEEKFKICKAAYESLCNKLAANGKWLKSRQSGRVRSI